LPAVAQGPPLNAEELIEAYISDPTADEWRFGRAIDLMASVCAMRMPQKDYNTLRTHIWASAILKDDWTTILENDDDLLAAASDTVFSRTLKLLCGLHKDNRERLPEQLASADELLKSVELQDMAKDPKFQYVLRAGEEKIHAWVSDKFHNPTTATGMDLGQEEHERSDDTLTGMEAMDI